MKATQELKHPNKRATWRAQRQSYGKTQKFTNTLASFIVYKINYYIKDIWVNQLYG